MVEIKHRHTGIVLCSFDVTTFTEAVGNAVREGVDLSCADLSYANLSSADLSSADLRCANLSSADLSSADLSSADLSSADLSYADLSCADLRCANLRYANLSSANLSSADLSYADLSCADLRCANLSSADLRCANLSSADLSSVNLSSVKNLSPLLLSQQSIVAQGNIIGWKKLRNEVVAKLLIPEDALRLNAVGSRKCRASYAIVQEIIGGKIGVDCFTGNLYYEVGKPVYPDAFDTDIFTECARGIHFFITREEAEAY